MPSPVGSRSAAGQQAWAPTMVSVRPAGVRLTVELPELLLEQFADHWPVDPAPATARPDIRLFADPDFGPPLLQLRADGERTWAPRGAVWPGPMMAAFDELALELTIERSDDLVIHAAGVVHDGNLAILIAPSGGGKSTAAAAAVTMGMGYLSDEAIAVAPEGRCRGFTRSLHLRGPLRHESALVDAEGITLMPVAPARRSEGGTAAMVVLLDRNLDVEGTSLHDRSRAEGVRAVLGAAFNIVVPGRYAVEAAARLVAGAVVGSVRYREADEALRLLVEGIGSGSRKLPAPYWVAEHEGLIAAGFEDSTFFVLPSTRRMMSVSDVLSPETLTVPSPYLNRIIEALTA